jgi:hypothetical protein
MNSEAVGGVNMGGKLIAEWDSAYGRKGTIRLALHECHVCRQAKICLLIDSSEKEYGPGAICADCANNAFSQV